jgi:hypothetical protein
MTWTAKPCIGSEKEASVTTDPVTVWSKIVDARGKQEFPPVVLSSYYSWYSGDGRWGTVIPEGMHNLLEGLEGKKGFAVWDRPLLGYYQSRNPNTIAAHFAWAKASGIDVLAVSFERRIPEDLLEQAQRTGIQITPYLEFVRGNTMAGKPVDFAESARNLAGYAKKYPKALWTIGGRPVILAYKRTLDETATPEFWAETLLGLHKEGLEFTILGDMSPLATSVGDDAKKKIAERWMSIFDGLHSYHILFQMRKDPTAELMKSRCLNLYEQELAILRKRGRIACLTVMPGWDNRPKQIPKDEPFMVVNRLDGEIYKAQWEAALTAGKPPNSSAGGGPDCVMVTSFNEWFEGGTIEPSCSTGTRYLEITRSFSAKFRGSSADDRELVLTRSDQGLTVTCIGSVTVGDTGDKPLPLRSSALPDDPMVDLLAVIQRAGGVAMSAHEAKDSEPERIHIDGGLRANNSRNRPWYSGKPWDGKTGEWYLRFDGVPRLEGVLGTHHLVVFLENSTVALADGVQVKLAYPAQAIGRSVADMSQVWVPLSLLTQSLKIPFKVISKAASPKTVTPAPKKTTATTEILFASPELLAAWRPRLVAVLAARTAAGKGPQVPFLDKEKIYVTAVDDKGITGSVQGRDLTLPWKALSLSQVTALAKAAVVDRDLESLRVAAVWTTASGETATAQKLLAMVGHLDQAAEKELRITLSSP